MITANLEKSFLIFIPFTTLSNWSVQHHLEQHSSYSDKYKLVEIGSFLSKDRTPIDIKDDKEYRRVTVKIKNGGVYLRDIKKGSDIGSKKQFIVSEGQFIISKIDARNGAMGIIPADLSGAIVTNDFPLFSINTNLINPQYFLLNITTDVFLKFAQSCSSGTTNRQRIDINSLLNQKIPLPSFVEQNQLIKEYDIKIREAEILEREAIELEKGIDRYLRNELNIRIEKKKAKDQVLYFVNYAVIDRWDVWINNNSNSEFDSTTKLKDLVCGNPQYGANVKGIHKKSDTRYIRITDINESGHLNSDFVSPEYVDDKYLLVENDFLIARSGNTVGKTFLYKEAYGRALFAGYLVKYVINTSKIIPEYLLYYTKSASFKNWVQVNQRVSGQPNINGKEFLSVPIPLPAISKQKEIVNHIKSIRNTIDEYYTEAKRKRVLAITDFEVKIFKKI